MTQQEWYSYVQDQLLHLHLYTAFAKKEYEPLRATLLLAYRKKQSKLQTATNTATPPAPFSGLESNGPLRGMQTFFRSNYRNHINLSAIADNKANIMISVNSILISVLITFISYRNIAETQPMILLPTVLFLVTGLASLIFAVLSARPKVTALNGKLAKPEERKRNLVFFGNFVSLPLEEYEQAMDELFRDDKLLYGNMVRDLYQLGKVLDKKYRFLTVSYNIFMLGFVATVGTFLFALFV